MYWEEKRVKVTEPLGLRSLKNVHVLNNSAWNESSFSDFIVDQVTLQRGILSLQETSWSYDFFFHFFFFKLIKAVWSLGTWKERVIYSMSLGIKEQKCLGSGSTGPAQDWRKSVFRGRQVKTPVPPPSGWGPCLIRSCPLPSLRPSFCPCFFSLPFFLWLFICHKVGRLVHIYTGLVWD